MGSAMLFSNAFGGAFAKQHHLISVGQTTTQSRLSELLRWDLENSIQGARRHKFHARKLTDR